MQNGMLTKSIIFVIIGVCICASTISGLSKTIENIRSVKGNDSASEITPCYDPPVACFQWYPYEPEVGQTVTFDASCSEGAITNYSWYYSCGAHFPISLGTGKLLTTSFNEPCGSGAYLIGLTLDGPGGSDSISHYVTVVTDKNTPPNTPEITGETNGVIQTSYTYVIQTTDPDQDDVEYFVDWGDNTSSGWIGPYNIGQIASANHSWDSKDTYSITVKARDEHGAESDWATLLVTMPSLYNKPMPLFFELLFQRFPNAFPLLRQLLDY